jgi:hypothetical protein
MTSTRERQALCCECGQLRMFKQARNHRGWWGQPNWHRSVGDLKCTHCGIVTAHALMLNTNDGEANDDQLQRVALGSFEGLWSDSERARLRRDYRQGNLPRNPYLHHNWFLSDEETARNAGESQVTAMCGLQVDLPANPEDCSSDYTEPCEIRDMEYEDPETGLWWVDMDCAHGVPDATGDGGLAFATPAPSPRAVKPSAPARLASAKISIGFIVQLLLRFRVLQPD